MNLTLGLFITVLVVGGQSYSCPDYDSIATSSVDPDKFALKDFTGEWYLMATSEPTLPAFCNCPVLKWFVDSDGGGEAIGSLFLKTAKAKLPAVKEYLLEVLERGDEKAIIFAHHQVMMDEISVLLEKRLAKDGLHHIRIDGKTPAAKRPDLVKQFQTDERCRIALLSITACSEGLTLTAAGLVIFAELYWVPGAVEQAEARAHRIGTTHNKVVVEFLVVPKSPEERIYNALERKKKDTSKMLDGTEESLGALERLTRKRAAQLADEKSQTTLNFGHQTVAEQLQSAAKRPRGRPPAKAVPSDATAKQDSVGSSASTPTETVSADAAGTDAQSPAPRSAEQTPKLTGDGAMSAEAKLTPSPVPRWKVEYLLRAAKG